ncbi:MAG TPA: MlaD family protein [Castellaniella sp.]|uniref:PqiB family protein n=1 Tax=Castellaniella sp. TaxID=1955812 RepID=UPI002EE01CCA
MTEEGQPIESFPEPAIPVLVSRRRWHWSWVWLVPLLALAVALSLLASVWVRTGPTITINFPTAAGLAVGQTKLRYRDVEVGEVKHIRVSDDRRQVQVEVQLRRSGAQYITQKGSKFWIVRPQVSLAGISGLNTLISGEYLSVDAPTRIEGSPTYSFQGLEYPPEVLNGQEGTRFVLQSDDLGSLSVGSRVYYRRVEVGRVVGDSMAPDGRSVKIQIFVRKPYDKFVTRDTRFWNSSGVDLSVSTDGVQLRTGGLAAILNGGVAFAQADESTSYDGVADLTPAKADSTYTLFATRDLALADPNGKATSIELHFDQSVRGLKVGAAVDFHGLEIGKVVDIDVEYDSRRKRFYVRVRALVYPMRFSDAYRSLVKAEHGKEGRALLEPLIQHGLRAQLRSASLLTGQQYVALDFFPDQKGIPVPQSPATTSGYLVPTIPGNFDRLQGQLANIVTKLDAVPLDGIGKELQANLKVLRALLLRLNGQVAPQATRTLKSAERSLDHVSQALSPDAPLVGGLQETLQELDRAARSLRQLSDTLQAHPDVLLRGQAPDHLH